MKITVQPSTLQGSLKIPASKSIMQRACIAALLSEEECVIGNPCLSEDCLNMLDVIQDLGAEVSSSDAGIHIKAKLDSPEAEVNCGESGLGTRLLIPILSLFNEELTLNASGSMSSRPIEPIIECLQKNGVTFTGSGFPLKIKGPIQPGEFELDGSISSQFLSGLLMVLPLLNDDSTIKVKNLKSKAYIDLTIEVMGYFGVQVVHKDYESFSIPGNQKYGSRSIFIDGDWSSAASMMVAAAVSARDAVRFEEVGGDFTQADQSITGVMLFAGCRFHREDNNYLLYPGKIRSFDFDATDCPDLFPVLAALAVFGKKASSIRGTHRLKHKESNRAEAIQKEFAKAGIKVELEDDVMTIHPGRPNSATLNSHGDHRIAMAAAILGLGGKAAITIEGAEAVRKSYPEFWNDLSELGAGLK